MAKKGQLYEANQALEAKVTMLSNMLDAMTTPTYSKSNINPAIVNSSDYVKVLSTTDRIKCCSRYITEIPELNLPSNRLELMFYLYGSLCFFRTSRLFVTTYTKYGQLNPLGDLDKVKPIDFAGKSYSDYRQVVYTNDIVLNPCVIVNDYTGTYIENQITPRSALSSVSISDEAAVYRQLKNNIKITAKKAIALIDNPNQRDAATKELSDILDDSNPVISIVGKGIGDVMKLHNLDTKVDFDGYMRAIENYQRRRSNDEGIKTRAPFEHKNNMLNSEVENDDVVSDMLLYDGLINRQVGIELMKKHSIIKEGSSVINPILEKPKEKDSSTVEKDKKAEK